MALLPSERFIVNTVMDDIVLFEVGSEREIVRVKASNHNDIAIAQKTIHESDLGEEDKAFAHFWFGYFYAESGMTEYYSIEVGMATHDDLQLGLTETETIWVAVSADYTEQEAILLACQLAHSYSCRGGMPTVTRLLNWPTDF